MKFLTNIYDPKTKEAKLYVTEGFDKLPDKAWKDYLVWLQNKIIGEPKATKKYTRKQLKAMGMVGVYTL